MLNSYNVLDIIPANDDLLINHNMLDASDDLSAISEWLNEFKAKKTTLDSYKSQILKFMLWLKLEAQKSLVELKKQDMSDYIEWFKNPPEKWIKNDKKRKSDIQIFKGAQSYTSLQYNIRIVNSLLNYLVESDYIAKNPLKLIKQFTKFKDMNDRKLEVRARILEPEEFQAVLTALDEIPETTEVERANKARTKLIFAMLYHLGLRVSELSRAMWDNFKIVQGKCWYFLIGKGDKPGQIPVNNELLGIIKKYRAYLELPTDISLFESNWVLPEKKELEPLSVRRIREIVKDVFKMAAEKFEDEKVREKLINQSPHDLRHLLASDLDAKGLSIMDTKEILRHSSEKVTEIYRNSKESKRHNALQANKIGLTELHKKEYQKSTKLKIAVQTGSCDPMSFRYFLNSLINTYLRGYSLAVDPGIDEINATYKKLSRTWQAQHLEVAVQEDIGAEKIQILIKSLERAASARGLKLIDIAVVRE